MMAEADITVNNHEVYTYVHHTTGGKYVFRGKTDKLVIYGFYSALYDASELEAVNATIFNHSSVDYKVWATENLNVEIFNRGNVLYKGNPEVHIDSLTSTGNVFRLE
jgi:GH43 family beta-xylosidase